jgi:hypothetical protein
MKIHMKEARKVAFTPGAAAVTMADGEFGYEWGDQKFLRKENAR